MAPTPFKWYLSVVSAAGLAVLGWLVATGDWAEVGHSGWEFGLFAAFTVVGELLPIRVPHRGTADEVTISTAFAFAVLLAFGVGPAVAVYAAASLIDSVVYRAPWNRALFNAAQYALSVAAAAGFLAALGDLPYSVHSVAAGIPAILGAGVTYFVVNTVLAGTGAALLQRVNVRDYLLSDLGFQVLNAAFLLALSPVIVASADASVWLIPLLAAPMLAVYIGGRQSMINDYRASHDVLTDLPNRSLLQDRLEHDLARARLEGSSVAVMLIDLDDFKEVNDTLGHHHGDLLLRAIGPRLGNVVRESDTLARLGGDEFAVVLSNVSAESDAVIVAEKLTSALKEPFPLEGLSLDVRASIGIAFFPEHGDGPEVLLQHADVALYRAKASKTGYETYASEEDTYSRDRLALAGQLRWAIDRGELVAHYQPKVAVATGRLEAVEALVRWQHPQLGLIGPDGFIPLAEHTGLIRPLTIYMLDAALEQWRKWRDDDIDVRMAVNLSTRSLLDQDLTATVRRLLDKWQVPRSALQLEITESAIMADARRATAVLDELRSMGISLAIDDFGTGYSSLGYLKRLPVDEVKIDKSFVQNLAANEDDAAIVHSMIELGHSLGVKTTAEGVESERVFALLAEWGCDFGQGYYLGRPVPALELIPQPTVGHEAAEAHGADERLGAPNGHPWWPAVPRAALSGMSASAEGAALGAELS